MKFNIPDEHRKSSGVYIIRNTVNKKVYIGSAKCFINRYRGHLHGLRYNEHHSRYLQRHCNKYGLECFEFNMLQLTDNDPVALALAEQSNIDNFKAANRRHGFNLMPMVFPSIRHSKESIAKMSRSKTGVKRSADAIQKISSSLKGNPNVGRRKGIKLSDTQCQNISIAKLGKPIWKNDSTEKRRATLAAKEEENPGFEAARRERLAAGARRQWERIKSGEIAAPKRKGIKRPQLSGKKQDPQIVAQRIASRLTNSAARKV